MSVLRQMSYRSIFVSIIFTFLVVTVPVQTAHGQQIVIGDGFNQCIKLGGITRDICCQAEKDDCDSFCFDLYDLGQIGPGGLVICQFDCDDGHDRCNDGKKTKVRISWPGLENLHIPGIFVDESRIEVDDGMGLSVSTNTTVLEVRREGVERGDSPCEAIVTSCRCPEGMKYEDRGAECRPFLASGAVECRICSVGEKSESCKPCDDCLPIVLSVHQCSGVESARTKKSLSD